MSKLHFSIVINAPKEKVWNAMLDDSSYRAWTETFGPGSHYVGDWSKGSKMLFLAPDRNGVLSGIVSRIKESRRHEYISIEHLGIVQAGKEDISSAAAKEWAGALENYTFEERDGVTTLLVDMVGDLGEFEQMFQNIWPKALQKLKGLAEGERAE